MPFFLFSFCYFPFGICLIRYSASYSLDWSSSNLAVLVIISFCLHWPTLFQNILASLLWAIFICLWYLSLWWEEEGSRSARRPPIVFFFNSIPTGPVYTLVLSCPRYCLDSLVNQSWNYRFSTTICSLHFLHGSLAKNPTQVINELLIIYLYFIL